MDWHIVFHRRNSMFEEQEELQKAWITVLQGDNNAES